MLDRTNQPVMRLVKLRSLSRPGIFHAPRYTVAIAKNSPLVAPLEKHPCPGWF
ncbi:hypothetical protein PAJL_620 [Cutibacterium acnes HL042PA3]|nr:hypothetical protein HMPREF9603_01462 [Cutibacterium acnes HL001PA1]EFT11030.1 hypothetical protein HMPREF9619_00891 [Cutibacterium acnes HL082PA2]EFT63818.1 hypothetical protein HMPREF9578_00454 [Cutibacterium acnes HL110PA4]EFT65127.1 hypothetical protein HMPREF9582_00964 [Cutibacterium acnes HL060PA1]EFT75321.1 hypothetical protein HMPREF9599_01170 [Cutibacterium acnes HL050PA2]EGE69528.1 hypothetical protein HMPREF9341_01861 [Cutibacterium acnes HL103PA1]ESK60024.1 hypothetical protein